MAKGKRVKEKIVKGRRIKEKVNYLKIFIIVFLIIGILFIANKVKNKNNNENNINQAYSIIEKEYQIDNLENYMFENAKMTIKDDVSYIDINVKNNGKEKIGQRKIQIIFLNNDEQIGVSYILPEIEVNSTYLLSFNIISNLSDIEKIEIK